MKSKLLFYTFVFFTAFVIIGDAYIYYIDGKTFESDFYYKVEFKNDSLQKEYAGELEKLEKALGIRVISSVSNVKGKNEAEYTIYSSKNNWKFIRERLKLNGNNETLRSFISGKRHIQIKPLEDLQMTSSDGLFYVFATKTQVDKLRSLTIDKYGMSKPVENSYPGDAGFILTTIWALVALIIMVYTYFDAVNHKRETLIKYFNGSERGHIIKMLMLKNTLVIGASSMMGMLLAELVTESTKLIRISLLALAALILLSNLLYLTLYRLNVKKILSRNQYSSGHKKILFIVLTLITATTVFCMGFNVKTIFDASRTLRQKEIWRSYAGYDNVAFIFRNLTENTNAETDKQYALQFYNQYIDKYKIHLSFDFEKNGGMSSSTVEGKDYFIYMNKYSVRSQDLKPDCFYLVSPYSKEKTKQKGIAEIADYLLNQHCKYKVITMPKDYEVLVLDINMNNLGENYKKDPIVIIDTHSTLPGKDAALGGYVSNALVKFDHSQDFNEFIKSIGYEDEIYYKNNVGKLYEQKCSEKMLLLVICLILSSMMLALFSITFSTVLKVDFDSRAMEVAVSKIHGKSLLNRYKSIFQMVTGSFAAGMILALLGKMLFPSFSTACALTGGSVVLVCILIILRIFIFRYEKKQIASTLKGGNQ